MEKYKLHLTYNNNLSFSDFNKICDSLNKSFNDINRENGIKNPKTIKEHNPVITNFDKGSVILELAVSFVVGVAASLVASAIYDRITKSVKNKVYVSIIENQDGSKEINIHIDN